MSLWISLLSGSLFGAGLALGGMTNPAKVLAFLDFAGAWDPSLALVMASAVAVTSVAYRQRLRSEAAASPTLAPIDARLLGGAAVFGLGWGLVGLCPGPALASLISGSPDVLIFFASMIAGMLLFQFGDSRMRRRRVADSLSGVP